MPQLTKLKSSKSARQYFSSAKALGTINQLCHFVVLVGRLCGNSCFATFAHLAACLVRLFDSLNID